MKNSSGPGHRQLIFPVFLPMQGCPGSCIYCDQRRISGSPDTDPAAKVGQARDFLRRNKGKQRQIAFYGGSFTALDEARREALMVPLLPEMDELCSFRISTHPLCIDGSILDWCKAWRISTIELGIQDFSDAVLSASGRGYSSARAMEAAMMAKAYGFELGIQLMPGLPGWTADSVIQNRRAVAEIKLDLLRLYPCLVLKDTPLCELWEQGLFQPLSLEQAISQCADWQALCDGLGIRIIKLGLPSNLAPDEVAAGPWHPAFGELVRAELLVRALEKVHPAGSIIKLDKKQWALIVSHGRFYLNILRDRIRNCSVESM